MTDNLMDILDTGKYTKIKVIGVGGGGMNAVHQMIREGIAGVEFLVVNTDQHILDLSPCDNKLAIGKRVDDVVRNIGIVGEDSHRNVSSPRINVRSDIEVLHQASERGVTQLRDVVCLLARLQHKRSDDGWVVGIEYRSGEIDVRAVDNLSVSLQTFNAEAFATRFDIMCDKCIAEICHVFFPFDFRLRKEPAHYDASRLSG